MIAIGCENISLSYGTDTVLDKVTFSINEGEKLGIVGLNGAGKTTLMKILASRVEPDTGRVFLSKNASIGYLEQHSLMQNLSENIYAQMLATFKENNALADYENDALRALHASRVRGVLKNLGFDENQSYTTFSGGQKTRAALAQIILNDFDILMLDEPTNHLDINSLVWLEGYLKSLNKTLIVISHDRYFLDRVTTKTLEIENCQAKLYNGNYSFYQKQKETDREIQRRHFQNQQKEIARIEAYIAQQKRWNRERNIIAAESRQKQLDKLVRVEKPRAEADKIKLKFAEAIRSGDRVLSVENVKKSFGDKEIIKNASFDIVIGDKTFLLGANGCGKSTLIKIIAGKIASNGGEIDFGYNVKVGYYDQENQNLDANNTVMDELWSVNETLSPGEIRNILARFLFFGDDCFKQVSVLSGGESARLSLAKLILKKNNFLILDEPTNHLDIVSREVLENALSEYGGTLLIVSHDRYFINKLANKIVYFGAVSEGETYVFNGTYEEFCDYKSKFLTEKTAENEEKTDNSENKQSYLAKKEEATQIRKTRRKIELMQAEAAKIESRIDEIDRESEAIATDYLRLSQLHDEKVEIEERLLEIYEFLENADESI